MKKHTKKILTLSAMALTGGAAFYAASHFAAKMIVDTALNRQMPKNIKTEKKNKSENDNALIEELKIKSNELENSRCETLETKASIDGEKLVGHWHHNENDSRIIIAMHGWRSNWSKDFGAISDFLHSNGCSVLYAEQRAHGESGGDYMGFGMLERYDCLDWIKKINEQNEKNLPIYLAGISMGASTVLMTSGFELPENVCGIIADCGFTSAKAIWEHIAINNMNMPYKSKATDILCKKKISLKSDEYTTLDGLKNNKVPVLFIHGTQDRLVPVEMTYENYMACNAPKRLFIVPGATHAKSYIVDKEGYEKTLKKFWEENDNNIKKSEISE